MTKLNDQEIISGLQKIAAAYMAPRSAYSSDASEEYRPAFTDKIKSAIKSYQPQPWHTIPAGGAVWGGVKSIGGLKNAITKERAAKATSESAENLAKMKSSAKKDPRAFLYKKNKALPGVLSRVRSKMVVGKAAKSHKKHVAQFADKIKKTKGKAGAIALGLGLGVAASGPATKYISNIIKSKKQARAAYAQ